MTDDGLDKESEILPTYSGPWRPSTYAQSRRPVRRSRIWFCIITLLGSAGIVMFGPLFRPGMAPPRPAPDFDTYIQPPTHDPQAVWVRRASSVKDALQHAYRGYEKYTTFPDDELRPVSASGQRK